jgi:Mrp family chromosome partitioning ATPase
MLCYPAGSQTTLRGKTVGVLGVHSGAGTTTIAAALALVATEKCGIRTTLIDANAENPTLSKFFKLNGAPGLAELANGDATHAECVQKWEKGGLSLISSSSSFKDRQRLDVAPKSISAAISSFQESSDLVIVDLPAAASADRAVALSHYLDFVLLVVQSEKTDVAAAQRIARRLSNSNHQVVGVVLNRSRRYVPRWLGNSLGLS